MPRTRSLPSEAPRIGQTVRFSSGRPLTAKDRSVVPDAIPFVGVQRLNGMDS